jgi:hypothetical protein
MVTREELETLFKALLPAGVKHLAPNDPKRLNFDRFGSTPKGLALKLRTKWELDEEEEATFWYIWDNHPARLAREVHQQGK